MTEAVERRILVVDDEAGVRSLVMAVLEDDYRVIGEADAARALTRLEGESFDLVISDIKMPGMDGISLLNEIRQRYPDLPVVIMTAYGTREYIVGSFQGGARYFLRKPFDGEELVRVVRTALRQAEPVSEQPVEVQSPLNDWVEISAPSHEQYLERFQEFCSILFESELGEKEKRDIRIAIDELGRNALEWGNRNDINRQFKIAYCLFDDKIVFKIEDEGEGFDIGAVPDPTEDPWGVVAQREQAGKRPGGYGLVLARKIMDNVYHNRKGNMVILEKRLPPRRLGGGEKGVGPASPPPEGTS